MNSIEGIMDIATFIMLGIIYNNDANNDHDNTIVTKTVFTRFSFKRILTKEIKFNHIVTGIKFMQYFY